MTMFPKYGIIRTSNKGDTLFRVYVEVEYYDAGESGRKELPSGRKKR